ncbi:MAG TPA: hypothetical protein VD839_17210 [Burkholderiales bacterium]|nr:hypothetical protein [Burkholderiales bacterium]
MNKHHSRIERWGGAAAGIVLVTLPLAGWSYRGSVSWMDIIVALAGIAALVLVVEDLLRRRHLARALKSPRSARRHAVCPRSGEPLEDTP